MQFKKNKPDTILVGLHGDGDLSWLSVETLNRRYRCSLSGQGETKLLGRRKLVSRYYALTKVQLIRFSRLLQKVRSEASGNASALWAAKALDTLEVSPPRSVHFVDFTLPNAFERGLILREMRQPTSRFRPALCSG
jgi:hypothetical protein